jgi:hypothetical protein
MLAAFTTSTLFLLCYVVYHAQVGSVPFTRQGFVRPLYFTILITHVALAFTLLPLPFAIAQKVNFMSALFGALGILVLYVLIVDLIRERRGTPGSLADRVVVMSPRPGTIECVLEIGLPRPRGLEARRAPEFARATGRITDIFLARGVLHGATVR